MKGNTESDQLRAPLPPDWAERIKQLVDDCPRWHTAKCNDTGGDDCLCKFAGLRRELHALVAGALAASSPTSEPREMACIDCWLTKTLDEKGRCDSCAARAARRAAPTPETRSHE